MTRSELKESFNQAWALRETEDYDQISAIAQRGLEESLALEDKALEALFLKLQAQVYSDQRQLRESLQLYKQIEGIYITLEDHAKQMHTLRHIGSTFHELGELECARKCLIQVIDAYGKDSPNDLESANAARIYALVMEELGNNETALKYWEQAQSLYKTVGIKEGVDECATHLKILSH